MDHIETHFIPVTRNKRSAGYLAHIDVPPTDYSIFAGSLIRALGDDPIAFASSRAGTFVELAVIRWLAELTYGSEANAYGTLCTGGTQANLIALLLHRNKQISRRGVDVNELGLAQALTKLGHSALAIFGSKGAHPSVQAAARQIGIGDANYHIIDVDGCGRMSILDLRDQMADAVSRRKLPMVIVLTAGTSGTGAIDPLKNALEIGQEYDVPVHVDAAHGGMLLFSNHWKSRLSDIHLADSVVLDPHKILGLNQGLGALLVKDPLLVEYLGKPNLPYFEESSVRDLQLFTMDGSRPLNSLGAWIQLQAFGRSGYAQIVDHFMRMTELFVGLLDRRHYELLTAPEMNIVLARPRGHHALERPRPPRRSVGLARGGSVRRPSRLRRVRRMDHRTQECPLGGLHVRLSRLLPSLPRLARDVIRN